MNPWQETLAHAGGICNITYWGRPAIIFRPPWQSHFPAHRVIAPSMSMQTRHENSPAEQYLRSYPITICYLDRLMQPLAHLRTQTRTQGLFHRRYRSHPWSRGLFSAACWASLCLQANHLLKCKTAASLKATACQHPASSAEVPRVQLKVSDMDRF